MQNKGMPPIFCRRLRCGQRMPYARRGLIQREMYFAGSDWLGQAIFLCPECGNRRMFALTVGGPMKETTADNVVIVMFRRLVRGLFKFLF